MIIMGTLLSHAIPDIGIAVNPGYAYLPFSIQHRGGLCAVAAGGIREGDRR